LFWRTIVPIVEVCVEVFFLVLFTLILFLAVGAVNHSSVVSSFLGRGVATLVGGCERIVFVGRVNVCFGELYLSYFALSCCSCSSSSCCWCWPNPSAKS
jgi:hypothetical protein